MVDGKEYLLLVNRTASEFNNEEFDAKVVGIEDEVVAEAGLEEALKFEDDAALFERILLIASIELYSSSLASSSCMTFSSSTVSSGVDFIMSSNVLIMKLMLGLCDGVEFQQDSTISRKRI